MYLQVKGYQHEEIQFNSKDRKISLHCFQYVMVPKMLNDTDAFIQYQIFSIPILYQVILSVPILSDTAFKTFFRYQILLIPVQRLPVPGIPGTGTSHSGIDISIYLHVIYFVSVSVTANCVCVCIRRCLTHRVSAYSHLCPMRGSLILSVGR